MNFRLWAAGTALTSFLAAGCTTSGTSESHASGALNHKGTATSQNLADSNHGSSELLKLSDNPARLFIEKYPDDINAARLSFIAEQPTARWLYKTDDNMLDVEAGTVKQANDQNKIPVIVTYVESYRDCGGNSAGGVDSEAEYQKFVDQSAGIQGTTKAINIIEPDGAAKITLPGQTGKSCMPAAQQKTTADEIRYAATAYKKNPNAKVYIDGGNPGYRKAGEIATVLKYLGVQRVDGYALGISAYYSDDQLDQYAHNVNNALGYDAHYVADTSRNGRKWNGFYCNPSSVRIASGRKPSLRTAYPLRDANLWVNLAGGSDGNGPGCTSDNSQGWSVSKDKHVNQVCPKIGPAGSWNACVANTMQLNAVKWGTN